jgi:hypothetical protein
VLQPGHDEIRARDSGAGLKLYSYFNDTRVRSFILNGAPVKSITWLDFPFSSHRPSHRRTEACRSTARICTARVNGLRAKNANEPCGRSSSTTHGVRHGPSRFSVRGGYGGRDICVTRSASATRYRYYGHTSWLVSPHDLAMHNRRLEVAEITCDRMHIIEFRKAFRGDVYARQWSKKLGAFMRLGAAP